MKRKPGRRVTRQRWRDGAPRLRVRVVAEPQRPALGARSRLVRILWLGGPPERDSEALGSAQPESAERRRAN